MKDKIESFLDKYYPEQLRFYPASAPYEPAPVVPAAPVYTTLIYNPIILPHAAPVPAPVPAPAKEEKKPSGGQIVAAAGILTAGAVALSYLWHDSDHLKEMIKLKEQLEQAVLSASAEDAAIYNNMLRFLDLEIGYARRSRVTKLLGTGSLSLTAAGAAIVTDFIVNMGWIGLAVGCGSFALWADNHFGWQHSASKRNELIRAIRSALAPAEAYKPL